jgi:hypothetical protein
MLFRIAARLPGERRGMRKVSREGAMTYREIALAVGCSVRGVQKIEARALRKLRIALAAKREAIVGLLQMKDAARPAHRQLRFEDSESEALRLLSQRLSQFPMSR